MKVAFYFPNGYASEMTEARQNNNFDGWVGRKFGERISTLISDDYTLDIRDDHFIVDFVFEDDGFAFLTLIGGRSVE